MLRVIKYNYIEDKAKYINSKIEELEEACDILKKHINDIAINYSSSNSVVLQKQYLTNLNRLYKYINVIKDYTKYYQEMAAFYKDSHDIALKEVTVNEELEGEELYE